MDVTRIVPRSDIHEHISIVPAKTVIHCLFSAQYFFFMHSLCACKQPRFMKQKAVRIMQIMMIQLGFFMYFNSRGWLKAAEGLGRTLTQSELSMVL